MAPMIKRLDPFRVHAVREAEAVTDDDDKVETEGDDEVETKGDDGGETTTHGVCTAPNPFFGLVVTIPAAAGVGLLGWWGTPWVAGLIKLWSGGEG